MLEKTLYSLSNFLPECILIITIAVCIFLDLIIRKKSPFISVIGIIGLLVSGYFAVLQFGLNELIFYGMVVIDPFAVFFKLLFVVSTVFIVLFAMTSKEISESTHRNEHVYLFIALALGAYLMASSVNMLMMYLSLETVSITSYVLAGYTKKDRRSSEAAMKYVIYGAASSGIMIYAMSLIYGFTGSMNVYEISNFLSTSGAGNPMLVISLIMILAGFGYKISSVPFHFWTPDIYEGAPIPVTAFLAVTSSAAGFAVLIRFLFLTFIKSGQLIDGKLQIIDNIRWEELIIVLSVASMIVGNFVAIWQHSLKRMLAYSSIAQGGYILLGLAVASKAGLTAMFVYLVAYLFMNLGAFYALIMIANKLNSDNINDMKGLGYRSPAVCIAMGIFMFALSGIPSTAGFIGKFYLFAALIDANLMWLAFVGVLNSVVSLFFYIKVLKMMFLAKPADGESNKIGYSFANYAILILLAVPTMFFGVYFTPLIKFAEYSASIFGLK